METVKHGDCCGMVEVNDGGCHTKSEGEVCETMSPIVEPGFSIEVRV